MEGKISIAFRGSPDYRARLQAEALRRRLKVQDLIEAAIEVYLGESGPRLVVSAETERRLQRAAKTHPHMDRNELLDMVLDEWLGKSSGSPEAKPIQFLSTILAEGTAKDIDVITASLAYFVEAIRGRKPAPSAKASRHST